MAQTDTAGTTNLLRVEHIRHSFSEMVAPGDGSLAGNLDEAALCIAAAVDPGLSIPDWLLRIDALASELDAASPAELAVALFGGASHDPELHFAGNRSAYYDPENSLLHRVLERRVGIPISLAVLLIEVGRRRGIELQGVGMPGHFLVRSPEGFIDAFDRGVLLDEAGCAALFRRLAGPHAELPPNALDPTPPAHIVKRMLFNLSAIGSSQHQRRTLRAVRSLLATFPDATHREHVHHAYAAAEIGQYHEAAQAGERALQTLPDQLQGKLGAQVEAWYAQLN